MRTRSLADVGRRLALLISLVCSVTAVAARIDVMEQPPAWKADLRRYGYLHDELVGQGPEDAARRITFGPNEELVVLSDTGFPSKSGKIRVRALVLEASTGSLIHQKDWTAVWPGAIAIHGNADGNYLIDTDEGPVLLSRGLQEILSRLPDGERMVTEDGRFFTIWGGEPGHAAMTFYDALTVEPTGATFPGRFDSIARDKVLETVESEGTIRYKTEILVRAKDQDRLPYSTSCHEIEGRFVSDGLFAVFGCGRLDLETLSGERTLTTKLHERGVWLGHASRDGSRFAVLTDDDRGGDETIRIFDVNDKREVFSTVIHERHDAHDHSGLALSPDGLALAVNTAGIMRYFKLPPKAGG